VVSKEFAAGIDDIGPSFLVGWRYNPKHEFGVLYLAVSPACCVLERGRQFGGGAEVFRPFVTGRFKVDVRRCLDLTHKDVLRTLEVSREDLLAGDDYALPQSIAREARRVGFEAIVAPSAASDRCVNLVVFKDKLHPHSYCLFDRFVD
jgi:RES domain-containing protein